MSLRWWEQEVSFLSKGSSHSLLHCGESEGLGAQELWTGKGKSSAGANAAAASTAWAGGRKPSRICVPHWACLLRRWSDFPQAGAHPLQPLWVRSQVQRSVGIVTLPICVPAYVAFRCLNIVWLCLCLTAFTSAVHSAKQVHSGWCHRSGEATVLCWHVSLSFRIQLIFP